MLEHPREQWDCLEGTDNMEGRGSANEKGKYRLYDDSSYVSNSPASPLVCSHVVESDFAASVDCADQMRSAVYNSGALVTKSSVSADSTTDSRESEVPSSIQRSSMVQREPRLVAQPQSRGHVLETEGSYFAPRHLLNHTTYLPLTSTTSTDSSPVQYSHASSSSLHSTQPTQYDPGSATFKHEERPGVLRDLSSVSTASTQTIVSTRTSTASPRPPTFTSRTVDPATTPRRRDGPIYPNQAFSVLQSQVYPPPYQPHPLRTRSSHPSPHSTYSSSEASARHSKENPDMKSGSRTEGNTPSPSPGLFTPSFPSPSQASTTDDDSQYSSPFLHPSHRQAPKE
jgi:hypothetical protein